MHCWPRWPKIFLWRNNSSNVHHTVIDTDIDPETDGSTYCTTCLRSSHTGLSVNSKINPLSLCVVQTQCRVHLVRRIKEYSNYITFVGFSISVHDFEFLVKIQTDEDSILLLFSFSTFPDTRGTSFNWSVPSIKIKQSG